MPQYDMIIIGAGLNGLTTAAYLAKSGRRVLVLEQRDVLGGAAATEEVFPGFKFDTVTHSAAGFSSQIVRDLDLGRHGLEIASPDPAVFAPQLDGDGLTLWRDGAKSVEAIRKFSNADAEKWPAFCKQMARLAGFLETVYAATPPLPTETTPGNLMTLGKLGLGLKGLGDKDRVEELRTLPMPVADLLDYWFESDLLKGTLGAGGITGLFQGPRSGGTAYMFLHHHVGSEEGAFRAARLVRGGMGQLAGALAAAAKSYGAEIRTGVAVSRINVRDGRAVSVHAANGEEFGARIIVSSADPRRTFFKLVDPFELEARFVNAVRHIRFKGAVAKVNLALGELPHFAGGDANNLRGTISISPSLDYLERAFDDAKYGGLSRRPYLEAIIPTLTDPALAPAGKHVMSVLVQYAPYRLKEGAWPEQREALGDLVVDTLAEYAPNLKSAIEHRQVLTPLDLEETYGLTEGNLNHGELTLDQFLFMRPVPGWAQYRTPIEGLYLCGAGAHPGGLPGAAGRNAAREMLRRSNA